MMKFFFPLLIALFPLASVQAAFGITNTALTDPWQADSGETNTATFSFDLDGQALEGTFSGSAEACVGDPDNTHYTWVGFTGGTRDPVTGEVADVVVTFENDIHITSTQYCVVVKLYLEGYGVVVTITFTITVTSTGSGFLNPPVVETIRDSNLDIDTITDSKGETGTGETRSISAQAGVVEAWGSSVALTGTIEFGDNIYLHVSSSSAYYIKIVLVEDDDTSLGLPIVVGTNTAAVGDTWATLVPLPLSYFTPPRDVTLLLTVDWNIASFRRRLAEPSEESGSEQYKVMVQLAPYDDGSNGASGAYEAKIISMTALTAGGAAAALLI
jgi:hypothetical protein